MLLGAGTDACELIHYGMELVNVRRSIFDVISTLFTAVTFHELFKFAALVRRNAFFGAVLISKRFFCQDKLGTNIGS